MEAIITDHNLPEVPSPISRCLDPNSLPSAVGLVENVKCQTEFSCSKKCQTEFSCSKKSYSQAVDIGTCTSTHQQNVTCQTDLTEFTAHSTLEDVATQTDSTDIDLEVYTLLQSVADGSSSLSDESCHVSTMARPVPVPVPRH